MCIHFADTPRDSDSASHDDADDQKSWSIVANMPSGDPHRFSAGVVRNDDGRLVVSLLNHAAPDVGVVQWLGSDDSEDPSHSIDYAVAFAERVVSEFSKPRTPLDDLLEILNNRPSFFVAAGLEYPGFEPVLEDPQPTPENFAS